MEALLKWCFDGGLVDTLKNKFKNERIKKKIT